MIARLQRTRRAGYLLMLALGIGGSGLQAETIRLTTGEEYLDAVILRVDGTNMVIRHTGGIAAIPLDQIANRSEFDVPAGPAPVPSIPGRGTADRFSTKPDEILHFLLLPEPLQDVVIARINATHRIIPGKGMVKIWTEGGNVSVDAVNMGIKPIDGRIADVAGDIYFLESPHIAVADPGNVTRLTGDVIAGIAVEDGVYTIGVKGHPGRRIKKYKLVDAQAITTELIVEELRFGREFLVSVPVPTLCRNCRGTRRVSVRENEPTGQARCADCGGTGNIPNPSSRPADRSPKDGIMRFGPVNRSDINYIPCPGCKGTGFVPAYRNVAVPCPACEGRGFTYTEVMKIIRP